MSVQMITNPVLRRLVVPHRMLVQRWTTTSANTSATTESEDYFVKNRALNRPMSPYVHYKPQMTTVLSITHRATGLGLSVLLYAGGISALFSQKTNFAEVLQSIETSIPPSILFSLKVLTGSAIVYHTLNGLRHLSWDFGYGFSLKQLYTSGTVVIVLSLLSALAIILTNN